MDTENNSFDILGGIRILDAGGWMAGTGGSAILGNIGAEVIKIEQPNRGDSYRAMSQQYGQVASVKGRHIGFETANLNKMSMTLDLTKKEGREILYQLIAKSDVFHTNFTEGARKKLGLFYDDLKAYNPGLVYCVTTGFGLRGPASHRRAYDTLAQAQSGLMWAAGDTDFDEPVGIVGAPLDWMGATLMAFGMVCALLARERLGIGQEVNVSLLGGGIFLQSLNANMSLLRGRHYGRFSRRKSANPLSNNYRCRDGKWLMLAEPVSDLYWEAFCDILGLGQIKKEARFANASERSKNREELIRVLDTTFATKSREEWLKIFDESKAAFGYAPVNDMSEAVTDEQVIENEHVVGFDHPVLGAIQMAGFPVAFSESPTHIRREAPELGQHTEQVLIDVLGYDWEQIGTLKEKGII